MRISDWSSDVCSSDLMSRSMTRPSFLPGRGDGRLVMSLVAFDVIFGSPDLIAAAVRHAGHGRGNLVAIADIFEILSGLRILRLAGAQLAEILAEEKERRPIALGRHVRHVREGRIGLADLLRQAFFQPNAPEIGRASWWDRECTSVYITVVA